MREVRRLSDFRDERRELFEVLAARQVGDDPAVDGVEVDLRMN